LFFFSSRRRHTRFKCDWSSDVCSSDLFGVMVDGAGIGSAMVANKIAGVSAASCPDPTTAKSAREHNDANVLTLGGGLTGERLARSEERRVGKEGRCRWGGGDGKEEVNS